MSWTVVQIVCARKLVENPESRNEFYENVVENLYDNHDIELGLGKDFVYVSLRLNDMDSILGTWDITELESKVRAEMKKALSLYPDIKCAGDERILIDIYYNNADSGLVYSKFGTFTEE